MPRFTRAEAFVAGLHLLDDFIRRYLVTLLLGEICVGQHASKACPYHPGSGGNSDCFAKVPAGQIDLFRPLIVNVASMYSFCLARGLYRKNRYRTGVLPDFAALLPPPPKKQAKPNRYPKLYQSPLLWTS